MRTAAPFLAAAFSALLFVTSLSALAEGASTHNVQWMRPAVSPTAALDGPSDGSNYNGFIPYAGGPVVTQVNVVAVFWGSGVDPTVVSDIGGFYSALTSGAFMHFVSEYSVVGQTIGSYGTVAGAFTISPINGNSVLQDADVPAELAQQIAQGALPAANANTIYMVHLPPGMTVMLDGAPSCSPGTSGSFCSYHSFSNGIIYVVLPDRSQGGCVPGPPGCNVNGPPCCGDKTPFEDLTTTASHELMESITDPEPLTNPAWMGPLVGEIGDLCAFSKIPGDVAYTTVVGQNGKTYQAQRGLSDAAQQAGLGPPGHAGCVGYPTTMCCNTDIDAGAPSGCSWLSSGATVCPSGGFGIAIPTVGGFGSATVLYDNRLLSLLPAEVGVPASGNRSFPKFGVGVQAKGVIESSPATVVGSSRVDLQACKLEYSIVSPK